MQIKAVTIEPDGHHVKDDDGNRFVIHGLVLHAYISGRPDKFFSPSTPFFKIACPPGTVHKAEIIAGNGLVNIVS